MRRLHHPTERVEKKKEDVEQNEEVCFLLHLTACHCVKTFRIPRSKPKLNMNEDPSFRGKRKDK